MLLLYAVTDRAWVGRQTLYEQVEQALMGGATLVQLREKNLCEEDFVREAIMMRELCHKYNIALIINDNVNVALKSNADGVHVGIEDMPVAEIRKKAPTDFIIGATAETTDQAIAAQKAGADYLGVGAIFPSSTKKPRGLSVITDPFPPASLKPSASLKVFMSPYSPPPPMFTTVIEVSGITCAPLAVIIDCPTTVFASTIFSIGSAGLSNSFCLWLSFLYLFIYPPQ